VAPDGLANDGAALRYFRLTLDFEKLDLHRGDLGLMESLGRIKFFEQPFDCFMFFTE